MPNNTPELGLQEAVDSDDTADYLTAMLAPSLSIVDGLYNATTGHNHNGAHQGAKIVAASINGPFDFPDWIRTNARPSAFAATGVGLEMSWESSQNRGLVQSYDRTGNTYRDTQIRGSTVILTNGPGQSLTLGLDGTLTIPGNISAPGGLTVTGDIHGRYLYTTDGANGVLYSPDGSLYLRPKAGSPVVCDQGGLSVALGIVAGTYLSAGVALSATTGDISANRGGTGYVFLGVGSRHVGFDGTNYVMPGTNLYVNGDLVVLVSLPLTLNNKSLQDPKMLGQTDIGSGTYTFPNVSGAAGMWRYVKAWGANRAMNLTNGTLIVGQVQYGSGQYILASGDSLSCYCDGGNWWVI